ncbi:hypothetical protein [Sorangium sp. So ce363]|uniref:hypothetical protein n=1 Tax=unclassified Sorangium TaxID=2621164 RepID=UPI003F612E63
MPPPLGSEHIAAWAARRGLAFTARPDEAWFRRWEPYDTIAPPSAYLSACTWTANPGHAVIAEPWYAEGEAEPLERTLLGFAAHPALQRRASMRVGEHFLTRVAFIESAPPPRVTLDDALWDAHVTTFAASQREAAGAFHPRLRKLLARRGFQGHLELRPGGLVVHCAGLRPIPEHYERLLGVVRELVNAAIPHA